MEQKETSKKRNKGNFKIYMQYVCTRIKKKKMTENSGYTFFNS